MIGLQPMEFHMKRILLLAVFLFAHALFLPMSSSAATFTNAQGETPRVVSLSNVAAKIEPHVFNQLQNGGAPSTLIVFAAQANLASARMLPTKELRGTFVLNNLRDIADRTQVTVRNLLNQNHLTYRAYYIVNVIAVDNLPANVAAQI